MNIECVVSRFYENTEWTAKLNASTIIVFSTLQI